MTNREFLFVSQLKKLQQGKNNENNDDDNTVRETKGNGLCLFWVQFLCSRKRKRRKFFDFSLLRI